MEKAETNSFFKNKIFFISALSINLIFHLYLAYQPLEFLDGLSIFDDAYYSLNIAKNIAEGLGPSYSGNYTNGFQPLYVFIMVPVYMVIKNDLFAPIRIALIISVIFDTLTLLFLMKIFSRIISSFYTIILLCSLWTLSYYVILNTLNGLETAISLFFIAASLYYYFKFKEAPNRIDLQFKLGALLGLAAFARIDSIFLTASILFLEFIRPLGNKNELILLLRRIGVILITAVVVYLPWMIYSYSYTGDIYQNSGKAVRFLGLIGVDENPTFENWYSQLLETGGAFIINTNLIPLALLILNLIIIFSLRKYDNKRVFFSKLSPAVLPLLFGLMLFNVYVFYVFGWWYFYRYFYPIMLFFFFFALISFDYINTLSISKWSLKTLQITIIAAVTLSSILVPAFRNIFYSPRYVSEGYMDLGMWASRSFKPGTIIGACQSGGVGYFAPNLKVINLDGVVNKESFESIKGKRLFEYIKKQKIEYIIGWNSDFKIIVTRSTNFQDIELKRMGKISEFKTMGKEWILAKVKY